MNWTSRRAHSSTGHRSFPCRAIQHCCMKTENLLGINWFWRHTSDKPEGRFLSRPEFGDASPRANVTIFDDDWDSILTDRARIVRLCLRLTGDPHVAEDLAQEALIEAWRHLDGLR